MDLVVRPAQQTCQAGPVSSMFWQFHKRQQERFLPYKVPHEHQPLVSTLPALSTVEPPAVQSAPQPAKPNVTNPWEIARLAQIKQCEDYTTVMEVMYDTTVAISSESMPTVGLILPIQAKLLRHINPMADDSAFLKPVKKAIHDDLIKRYQAQEVRSFLEMAAAMDPRTKLRRCIPSDAWDRIKEKQVEHFTETAVAVKCEPEAEPESALTSKVKSMEVKAEPGTESQSPLPKKIKLDSVLCDDDIEIVSCHVLSPVQMAKQELHKYKLMRKVPSDGNPLSFWISHRLLGDDDDERNGFYARKRLCWCNIACVEGTTTIHYTKCQCRRNWLRHLAKSTHAHPLCIEYKQ